MRHSYLRLPVDPDRGFPQAFRMALAGRAYAIALSVTVTDDALLDSALPLQLPQPGAFLVLDLAREAERGPEPMLRRKLVPHLEYEADELALVVLDLAVHPRNLGAPGAHGSRVVAGVAARWAS
jgi:hypothetical protein